MLIDYARGVNNINTILWDVRKTEAGEWISTGLRHLFLTHPSLDDALAFYLTYYPETETIALVLNNKYHSIYIEHEMREMLVDRFLTKIRNETEGEQTDA
jgi:hypothetical protein